jgi:hypothetical protein
MSALDKISIDQILESLRSNISPEKGKVINKTRLVNTLNYINFKDEEIILYFRHTKYATTLSIRVKTLPCNGNTLECLWNNEESILQKIKFYEFRNLIISNGKKMLIVKPDLKKIDENKIIFSLPDSAYELNMRRAKRYPCKGITAELIQNGIIFQGELVDFSAVSFGIKIYLPPTQSFLWINTDKDVDIILKDKNNIFYTGRCKITSHSGGHNIKNIILEPLYDNIPRFKKRNFRSLRQKLLPSPNIIFKHPLIGKFINLTVEDISCLGLSTEEYYESSILLPGLIIPNLEIEFGNTFKISCSAQVVYKQLYENSTDDLIVKCGITFLDMDIQDQARLSSILHSASNKKTFVCNRVDLNDLWNFFFETGFVYPQKYSHIYLNKEKFINIYEKLYNKNPNIARHFVYQDRGIIQGHISMLRVYEKTWLFHHHASNKSHKAGLVVLDQISRYTHDFYCLNSSHLNFIISYFRPENRFPMRFFGEFVKYLNDPKGCSIDPLAYFNFPKSFEQWNSPGFIITKTTKDDLIELKGFYEYNSGGLLLAALDLEPDMIDFNNLSREYEKAGFKRERHLFSLKQEGILKAIFMINITDAGLNLSNLTNCIHAIILDQEDLPRQAFISSLSKFSKYFDLDNVSVLLYPASYAEKQIIPYEKIYNLWVLNIPRSDDQYFKYIEKFLKHI